jgi:hypothetical protein
MTSLLRIIGDSNQNNTEIRNTFKEPLTIKENSKIALIGMNAMLEADVAPNVDFVIDSLNSQFKYGVVNATANGLVYGNITHGTYNRTQFIKEFALAMNYPVVTDGTTAILADDRRCLGLHNAASLVNGKIEITTRKADYDSPDLDTGINTGVWVYLNELKHASVVTPDGFTATTDVASVTEILSFGGVPLVSSLIVATFENPETVDMGLYVCDLVDPDNIYWGVHVVNGAYKFKTRTDDIDLLNGLIPIVAIDGDAIEIRQFGGTVTIQISANPIIIKTGIIPRSQIDQSKQTLTWLLSANTDGQISHIILTELEGVSPPSLSLKLEVDVTAGLQFRSLAGEPAKLLATYVGFPGDYELLVYRPKTAHNPSVIVGATDPTGIPSISSIIITIEGLGILKSVDGSNISKAPSNIVYAVHKLKDIGQFLQIDVPQPIYLALNNNKPVNVNELRVRMLEASGFNPLKFIGKPSFTFVIR